MDAMIFISSGGAEQMLNAQAVHANNLANVNTVGFRSDRVQFSSVSVPGPGLNTKTYAYAIEPQTDFDAGELIPTKRSLDVAIEGDGWIAVQAKDGTEAYTRDGGFTINAEGVLMTRNNIPVLGGGGPITIPPAQKIDVGIDGTITIVPLEGTANQEIILDRIKLVKPDKADLQKGKDGLIRNKSGAAAEPDATVRLMNGYLEGSNVSAVESLTHMISIARQYEMQMKAMHFAHDNDKATQDLLMV